MNLKSKIKIKDSNPEVTDTEFKEYLTTALNQLLAEEFQAWYQYFIVDNFLVGRERPSIEYKFKDNAYDELYDHAVKLLARMNELEIPCLVKSPADWAKYSTLAFGTADYDTLSQLDLNIKAEEDAIAHYKDVLENVGDKDLTTRDMLKHILADEEKHLTTLRDFKNDIEHHSQVSDAKKVTDGLVNYLRGGKPSKEMFNTFKNAVNEGNFFYPTAGTITSMGKTYLAFRLEVAGVVGDIGDLGKLKMTKVKTIKKSTSGTEILFCYFPESGSYNVQDEHDLDDNKLDK